DFGKTKIKFGLLGKCTFSYKIEFFQVTRLTHPLCEIERGSCRGSHLTTHLHHLLVRLVSIESRLRPPGKIEHLCSDAEFYLFESCCCDSLTEWCIQKVNEIHRYSEVEIH